MNTAVASVVKRLLDIVVSLVGLALCGPIMVMITMLIKVTSPGPVLYRGRRVGLAGRPFYILKFRSMVVDAERLGGSATAGDDPRITPIGAFLRRYKLDELPQLINVLSGDMSVVGPRPEVQKYVDLYTEAERRILTLKPGITDWASIWNSNEAEVLEGSGDPEKTYEQLIRPTKLRLQLLYHQNHSLPTDLKILIHTLCKLICSDWLPRELAPLGRIKTYRMVQQATAQAGQDPVS
jgi:lipopolysaccharide/colanic/teichoic acid biosynthesis glycosyltransferase